MVHPNGSDLDILIADDEDYCLLIREALEENHFAGGVTFVHSGLEMLQCLHRLGDYQQCKTPDLVIFDIDLSTQDAYAALRDIRVDQNLSSIPVIVFIKATTPEEDIDICHDLGATSYLSKPNSFQGWVHLMRSILGVYSPRPGAHADASIHQAGSDLPDAEDEGKGDAGTKRSPPFHNNG